MPKNVVFAYNGRVEVDHDGNYYGNELNDRLVERYLFFGNQIKFLVRFRRINNEERKGLTPFVSKNLGLVEIPDFTKPNLFIKNIRAIHQIIECEVRGAEVVIARLPSLIGRESIKYAQKNKIPYLVEIVGCPWDALYNHSFLGRLYAPFAYLALKRQVKNCPFVLYVTSSFLQKRYPTQGYGVGITDVVLKGISKEALKQRLDKIAITDIRKNGLTFGTAAGLDVRYKGQEYVIHAIAQLKKKGIRCKYILVGKGSGRRLRDLVDKLGVQDLVTIRGQIKHDEVFDFLDGLDIYIQPSKQEGLPRAVVEAMSRACPVIGSITGGIPELLSSTMTFKKGNVSQIVNIIENISTVKLNEEAQKNFMLAKTFETSALDIKRKEFYAAFKQKSGIK